MESPTLRNPSSVVNLNLSFKNITNLQEIKQYKNLIELDLSGNTFPNPNEELAVLKNFNYLKKLNLTYTNLESVPALPKALETLILNNNTISQIGANLLNLTRLATLDLSNNEIEDVSPLLQLTGLKHLFLKNNKVRSFGMLASLTKLQELDLDSNFVSELSDLLQFAQHTNIKVICVRNTQFCNDETSRIGAQSILPNLPFFRDGAFCKSGKSLKASFTYTNMLETSNPNRSVLINKSLINSKKNFSDSDLSDDFSFDQEPETVNASILGSVRSNILETAFTNNQATENSLRANRMHHQSLDASRNPSQFESKMSDLERAASTRQNSQRAHEGGHDHHKHTSFNFNRPYGRKATMNMKLDLSAILKTSCGKTSEMTPINVPGSLSKEINDSSQKIMIPHFSSNNSANGTPQKLPISIPGYPAAEFEKDLKISANQTINSFVNQLESVDPVSSYRVTFQNDNLPLGEAYEAVKKENLELEKIKEDLMQRLATLGKENDDLKKDSAKNKVLHGELTENIERMRFENEGLWQENGELRNQMEERYQTLKLICDKYIDSKDISPFSTEELSFDRLLVNVEEKLKKTNLAIQAEMNKRILEKFDQLRDYYRHKQDKLLMTINDLESRIAFQATDKIHSLQSTLNTYQINYQTLYKKYNKLKKSVLERNKTEASNVNLSINQSSNPNFSNISVETDVSLNQSTSKSRPFENNFKISSNIRKENRIEDPINNLKTENIYLKNSLEGVSKKVENLVRENDELKTETNRNAYVLKLRIRELENENVNLLSILKQHKIKSPSQSLVLDKSADSIPKITSAKNARSYAISLEQDANLLKEESTHNNSLYIENKKKERDQSSSHSKTKTPTLKLKKKVVEVDLKHKDKSGSKKNVLLTGEHHHENSGAKAHLKYMFTELSAVVKGVGK